MSCKRTTVKNKVQAKAKYHVMTEMGILYIHLFVHSSFRTNLIVFNRSSILLRWLKMRIVKIECFFACYVKDLVITKYLAQ